MNLNRLSVRERVNLLALIPLLVVVVLNVPLLAGRLDEARAAGATSLTADAAGRVSTLIEMIQRARLLSVAYLSASEVAPNSLAVQLQEIDQRRAELVADEQISSIPALRTALDRLQLEFVGTSVLTGWGSDLQAVDDYGNIVVEVIDALALTQNRQVDRAGTVTLGTLDALLRADEAASKRSALILLAATNPVNRDRAIEAARRLEVTASVTAEQFRRLADPDSVALFALADSGASATRLASAESELTAAAGTKATASTALTAQVLAAGQAQTEIRQMVETRISQNAAEDAQRHLYAAWGISAAVALVGLLILIAVVTLSVVVGRSVSRPLRRLTVAAGEVADLAQEELMRVADEDAQEVHVPRLAAIEVDSEDEIADLATAFNRVQATAAQLLERQVISRRNVASMFASMGRRTSNLVGRQLALIDSLEHAEEDPDTLSTLYRLDHTATRLRRNASSLVVLSGGAENLGEGRPMPVADVVRAALGTVEDYQRVELHQLPGLWVAPGVVGDLSLLVAELLDNAVSFSPPRTNVEVVGTVAADGSCTVSVVDHGLGMPEARMAEENGRLRRRERLDLAPSDVLGLFVVGRIARRHGIDVRLEPTDPSGVTVVISLPASVMVDGRAAVPGRPAGPRADTPAELPVQARPALPVQGHPASQAPAAAWPPPGERAPDVPAAPAAGWPFQTPQVPAARHDAAGSGPNRRGRGRYWATDPATAPAEAPPVHQLPQPPQPPRSPYPQDPSHSPGQPYSPEQPYFQEQPQPTGRPHPAERSYDFRAPDRYQAAPPPAAPPQTPIGRESITRRVPGRHLAGLDLGLPAGGAGAAPVSRGLEPEAVRNQMLDLEEAIGRAHRSPRPDAAPRPVQGPSGPPHLAPPRATPPQATPPQAAPPQAAPPQAAPLGGLKRRVPGAALRGLVGLDDAVALGRPGGRRDPGAQDGPGRTASPAAPREIDAGQVRDELDDLDQAMRRARAGSPPADTSSPRLPQQAPLSQAHPSQPLRHQAPAPRPTGPQPLAPQPLAAQPPAAQAPQPGTAAPGRPLTRRVRGANLATFPSGIAVQGGTAGGGATPGRNTGPTTGSIALIPERPEDVLSWATDLEAALARIEIRSEERRTSDPGHNPSPRVEGDDE